MTEKGKAAAPAPDMPPTPAAPASPASADVSDTGAAPVAPSGHTTPPMGIPAHLPTLPEKDIPAKSSAPAGVPAPGLLPPAEPLTAAHAAAVHRVRGSFTTIEVRDEIRKRNTLILIALIPAIGGALAMFGWRPAINFVITWLAAQFAGTLFKKIMHTPHEPSGYRFARALSSVLLIGCLPPNLPWWGALSGGILIDLFSRMVAQFPRWARWFRHISPVVPSLVVLYLVGPLLIPGVLYQKNYPVLVNYALPVGWLVDPGVEEMIRAPNAGNKVPPFTWDIDHCMEQTEHTQMLRRGKLPMVDAVSRPSPMAVVRNRVPAQAAAAQEVEETPFDALDGILGYKTGATLEVHSLALLFGLLLLCINNILTWRFVMGSLLGAFFFGFVSGGLVDHTVWERLSQGMEHAVMGGMLLTLFLFAHPVGLKVSYTASWLQGLLLSLLIVLFRRLLWQTGWSVPDATLVAILISAMVLPTIESLSRKHLRDTTVAA